MNGKLHDTRTEWVDPDDAPELTEEWFANATPMIGGREVTMEEFREAARKSFPRNASPADAARMAVTIDYDIDIIEAFRATGDGWEARMNDALRDWIKAHLV